jgi:hypothetical protein
MNNIKIIRLQDDSDIICSMEEIRDGEYVLSDPMYFEMQTKGLATHIIMDFYLPIQLVERNEVVVKEKDIVFKVTPSGDFAEYYMNSVDSFKKLKPEGDFEEETQEQLKERIKELVTQAFMEMDPEEKVIH